MFAKIVAFGAVLAAASANPHGHGQAVSSQSIIRHDAPVHHGYEHGAQLSHYESSVSHYSAPAHYAAPVAHYAAPIAHHDDGHDTYAHPKYDFSYSVSDPHTGDHKSQHESRDGDRVHGSYSLAQPDGTLRKVEYTAGHEGFNAHVHNSGHSLHPHNYGHSYGHGYGY